MERLLILGQGYVGAALAHAAAAAGCVVAGTRQQPAPGLLAYAGHLTPAISAALAEATIVFCTIPPGPAHPALLALGRGDLPHCRWLGLCSTTGVYGDHQGRWVDETTPATPHNPRAAARWQLEQAWQQWALRLTLPLTRFRIAGIYGPDRSVLGEVQAGTARRIDAPGHVFNRIHRDDIVTAILAAAAAGYDGLLNLADDLPAPSRAVVEYACDLLGRPWPPLLSLTAAGLGPMGDGFYRECKRVRNDRLKSLVRTLAYPDFRAGLQAIYAGMASPEQTR